MNYDKLSNNDENSDAVENEWVKAFETPEDGANEKTDGGIEEQTDNTVEAHEQQERHPLADVEPGLAVDVYKNTHPGYASNEKWREDFSNWQSEEWGVGLEGYDTLTDEEKADFAGFVHDEMVKDWREERAQAQAEAAEIDSAVGQGVAEIWKAQTQNDLIAQDGRSRQRALNRIDGSLREAGDVQGIKDETERQLGEIQGVVAEGERADRAYDAVGRAQRAIFEARRNAGLIEENGRASNEVRAEISDFLANQPEGLSEEEFNAMLDSYVTQQVGAAEAYKQQQEADAAAKQEIDSAVNKGSLDIWKAQAQNDLIASDGRSQVNARRNIGESLRENGGDVQGIEDETERQLGEIQGVVAEGERADRAYDAVNKAQTQIFEARRDAGLIEGNGRTLNGIGSELRDFLANQPEGLSEEEFNSMLDNYVAQKVGEANAFKQQQEAAAAEEQAIDSAINKGSLDIWRAQAQGGLAGDDSRSRIRDMNRISESLRENGGDAQGIRDEAERQLGEVQGVITEGEQVDRAYDAVGKAQRAIFEARRNAGLIEENGRTLNEVGAEISDFLANQPEGLSEEEFNSMLDNYVAQQVGAAEAYRQQQQDNELVNEAVRDGVGKIALAEEHAGFGSKNGREFQQHSRALADSLRSVERPEGMSAEEYAKKIGEETARMTEKVREIGDDGERADRAYAAYDDARAKIARAEYNAGMGSSQEDMKRIDDELTAYLSSLSPDITEEEFNNALNSYVDDKIAQAINYRNGQQSA